MNNSQEIINRYNINKIVKNHFDLNKKSYLKFYNHLYFENDIPKEYLKILNNSPDKRISYKIPEEEIIDIFEGIDASWIEFKRVYKKFYLNTSLLYKEYYNNITNNNLKILKALYKFYKEYLLQKNKIIHLYSDPFIDDFSSFIYKEILEKYYLGCSVNEAKVNLTIKYIEENGITVELDKYLQTFLHETFSEITKYKLPKNKKLKIVLSLNFADWFLSSTEETWSSCLDLESDYNHCAWAGLPALITDKNRALIYITDGKTKKYENIKVERMLCRTWVILMRDKSTNKTMFYAPRTYPMNIDIKSVILKYFNINVITSFCKNNKIVSRYYFELITFSGNFYQSIFNDGLCVNLGSKNKCKYYQSIFNDGLCVNLGSKNKCKYYYGKYGYYILGRGISVYPSKRIIYDDDDNEIEETIHFDFDMGLKYLITNNFKLTNYLDL